MSDLTEILGDVIFRKLESSITLQDSFPLLSIESITSTSSNELSSTNSETKLIRSKSEPILGPIFSNSLNKTVYQVVKKPRMIWSKSSFGSDELIQDNEDLIDDQNEMRVENDEDIEEEEEEEDSPVSSNYPSNFNSSNNSYLNRFETETESKNDLSNSLRISSINCKRSNTQEKVKQELLRLTKPLREGIISRERLLPSSRIKQIGVGGRGNQRHSSTSLIDQTLLNHSLENLNSIIDQNNLNPSLVLSSSLNSSLNSIRSSFIQTNDEIPLMMPRPIRAWKS